MQNIIFFIIINKFNDFIKQKYMKHLSLEFYTRINNLFIFSIIYSLQFFFIVINKFAYFYLFKLNFKDIKPLWKNTGNIILF